MKRYTRKKKAKSLICTVLNQQYVDLTAHEHCSSQ